ncbi:hypothetical protein BD410DRAFT_899216 [Rickenella mellea]|uniref:HNH nuclease domain-containing protein n=1 Tax=Rickenella mellea TaxID=50990 RepID=A0A4Y7PZV8_9AGAM|nr:hypothetical protein BD410DRAFT_899216 [Rickenella mellea]
MSCTLRHISCPNDPLSNAGMSSFGALIRIRSPLSPLKVSTIYRWIDIAYRTSYPYVGVSTTAFALHPVSVEPSGPITYTVKRNGPPLSRQSQEMVLPGDYGIYNTGMKFYLVALATCQFDSHRWINARVLLSIYATALNVAIAEGHGACKCCARRKTVFPLSFVDKAFERDGHCVLTGSRDSDELTATWILPPSLGYLLSDDEYLQNQYQESPESCDMSHLMTLTNVLSMRKDIAHLFQDNAIGVDVDDNHRIVVFDQPKYGYPPLNTTLTVFDGPDRPSDQFLRLHFAQGLAASAFGGDLTDDFKDGEVEGFMETLEEMSPDDPLRQGFLGIQIQQFYVRQTLKTLSDFPNESGEFVEPWDQTSADEAE